MTTALAITTIGFGASLGLALWRLVDLVRTTGELRLELRGVLEHARDATAKLKQEKERTLGYQAIVRKLKEGIDRKNALLEKHNVSPSVVIDDVLSEGGGKA
jgi:DNA primase large subunit